MGAGAGRGWVDISMKIPEIDDLCQVSTHRESNGKKMENEMEAGFIWGLTC